MKDVSEFTDDELMEEIEYQNEWLKDDVFEYNAFNRGDGGWKRNDRIFALQEEARRRGLMEPLPLTEGEVAEQDDDFESIRKHMESLGYRWRQFHAYFWLNGGTGADVVRFPQAVEIWQQYTIEQARRINRAEMWGE